MRKSLSLRTTNNRVPFLPRLLKTALSPEAALQILTSKGYQLLEFDIFHIARACIGTSVYEWHHHPDDAPGFVDCSTFVRWLYSHYGIWLPRYSVQQHQLGHNVAFEQRLPGDLFFCQGHYGKFWSDPTKKVGHVGMLTSTSTVIHAAGGDKGVIETDLRAFTEPQNKFRGIRRICSLPRTKVLQVRPGRLIETLDDLRWDILNTFGRA